VVSQAKMAILLLRKTAIERSWEMSNPIGEPKQVGSRIEQSSRRSIAGSSLLLKPL